MISLFLESSGLVIMAGTDRSGQYTQQFLQILDPLPRGRKTGWTEVNQKFIPTPTVHEHTTHLQTPIFEVR